MVVLEPNGEKRTELKGEAGQNVKMSKLIFWSACQRVSVRMISDFGVLEWTLAQDGHSRFVVLRCMTWYSYTKVLFDVLLVVSLYR